jgi:hypothetical protein
VPVVDVDAALVADSSLAGDAVMLWSAESDFDSAAVMGSNLTGVFPLEAALLASSTVVSALIAEDSAVAGMAGTSSFSSPELILVHRPETVHIPIGSSVAKPRAYVPPVQTPKYGIMPPRRR